MRAIQIAFIASSIAAGVLAAACGSSDSNNLTATAGDAGDAATTGDDANVPDASEAATPYPAFKPSDVPQVTNANGGPVMASPKIVPIFFAGDDPNTVASVKDFVSKVGGTQYWSALTEYKVGAATGESPIDLTYMPPTTWDDSQIQAFLDGKLEPSLDPAFPKPDANTIYVFFTPPGVTVTMSSTGFPPPGDGGVPEAGAADAGDGGGGTTVVASSCTDFGGYHDNITLSDGTTNVAYAVVPRCTSFGPNISGLDAITGPASHELSEAATDPFPSANPAFSMVDRPHSYWARLLGGGEVGDMCAQNPQSFTKFPELPMYMVQRNWSNAAAMAGTDPCLPLPMGDTYFNAYPVLKDTISVTFRGQTVMMKGVSIPVGSSAPVELDLASTGPTGPWTVEALDQSQLAGATTPTYLGFAFDKNSGQNGDKITLTITVKTQGRNKTEPFLVVSKMGSGASELVNFWAGIVGN